MTREDWRRIEEIADQILDLPRAERAEALDACCGDDEELRTAVSEFLEACQVVDTVVEGLPVPGAAELFPEPAPRPQGPTPLSPGTVVGKYRIVRPVGEGGMGAVYLAERADGAFRKRLALKILWRETTVTQQDVAQFRAERQILAGLEHANIARLVDGGVTEHGLPYLVMEYVRGETATAYCDARRLTVTGRLRLFLGVCDAVAYAHRHLVVHQDLKPGNILVTGEGEVKLVDFGIGKALHQERSVDGGPDSEPAAAHPLTLAYASPEQVTGKATGTATDVYSLGVVLYELLTGRSPYAAEAGNRMALQMAVCTGTVTPPSDAAQAPPDGGRGLAAETLAGRRGASPIQLARRLRGDLDAIVLRALEKDPDRRYAGVGDLAADIRRHLARFPVRARPRTRPYVVGRFLRRNALGAALTATAATVLLVGVLSTLWQYRERLKGEEEIARVTVEMLSDIRDLNPERFPQGGLSTGDLIQAQREKIQPYRETPEVYVRGLTEIGRLSLSWNEWMLAEATFREAFALVRDDPPLERRALVESTMGIGMARMGLYDLDEAVVWLRRSVDATRDWEDPDPGLVVEALNGLAYALANDALPENDAEAQARFLEAQSVPLDRVADSTALRVATLEGLGDLEQARGNHRQAIALYDRALGRHLTVASDSSDTTGDLAFASGLAHLALGQEGEGDAVQLELAELMHQRALAIFLHLMGPDDILVGESWYALGQTAQARGRTPEAVARYREADRIFSLNPAESGERLGYVRDQLRDLARGGGTP